MRNKTKGSMGSKFLGASALVLLSTAHLSAQACGPEPFVGEICTFAFDFCPDGYVAAAGQQLPVNQYQALFALIGVRYGGNGNPYFNVPDLRGRVAVGTNPQAIPGVGVVTLGQKDGLESATLTTNNLPSQAGVVGFAAGSLFNGSLSLPVTGGTVSGQTISGSVTVNALNGTTAGGGVNTPDSGRNTVGKMGNTSNGFYAPGTPIAVPSTHNLTVSGGTISNATASGTVQLPAANTTVPVTINSGGPLPVATIPPRLGQTVCIATEGIFPTRP